MWVFRSMPQCGCLGACLDVGVSEHASMWVFRSMSQCGCLGACLNVGV